MTKIHPHHDTIVAYLEGKAVQIKVGMEKLGLQEYWADVESYSTNGGVMPAFSKDAEYRIKPIVKPNITKKAIVELKDVGTTKQLVMIRVSEHWETANLELTFDGNTNQLVSANILK